MSMRGRGLIGLRSLNKFPEPSTEQPLSLEGPRGMSCGLLNTQGL